MTIERVLQLAYARAIDELAENTCKRIDNPTNTAYVIAERISCQEVNFLSKQIKKLTEEDEKKRTCYL